MRRRVTVMNEEYRCTLVHACFVACHSHCTATSEHAGDTNKAFQARFDARSTFRPYHVTELRGTDTPVPVPSQDTHTVHTLAQHSARASEPCHS